MACLQQGLVHMLMYNTRSGKPGIDWEFDSCIYLNYSQCIKVTKYGQLLSTQC